MSALVPAFAPPERLLLGPGPSPVPSRILEALARPTIGHLDPCFLQLMDELRDMLRLAFRTQNELTIPMSGTGSSGMETCLVNLLEPGDSLLVLVNGVFGTRIVDLAERLGAKVDSMQANWGEGFDPNQVIDKLKSKSYDAIAVVHAETSTGYCQPVAEIAAAARESGALVILDAVTSFCGTPLEIDEWQIDAVYSGTQKCLSTPPGLSPISFGPRAVERMQRRKSKSISWYLDLAMIQNYWGQARAYHHTAPINMLYGLHEALRMVLEEGLEQRWERHAQMGARLAAGLEGMGMRLLVDKDHRLPQLTSVCIPDGVDDLRVRQALLKDHNIEIGGGLGSLAKKVWRIGLMGNGARPEVVDRLLDALRQTI